MRNRLRPALGPGAVRSSELKVRRGEVSTGVDRPRYDPLSAFHLYMREVGEVPLLTPDEEIQLAALIHRGDAAARDQMIRANLRLVVKIAREYDGLGLLLL